MARFQTRRFSSPPSQRHGHGGRREGRGLVADAVQFDLCARLVRLRRGQQRRRGRALHPRVVDDVVKGRTIGLPQRQAPLDQLLALCR